MSSSKIKSLAIVALLLLNGFFLIIIIVDGAAAARAEREAIENLCTILRANGLYITSEDIRVNTALRTMRTMRAADTETVIASAFFGEAFTVEQGVISVYINEEIGTAEFASWGDYEIILKPGVITSAGDTLRTVQNLLYSMRIDTSEPVLSGSHGNEVVTAVCTYKGAEIFNNTVEFIFANGSLQAVRGRYVAGVEVAEDGSQISSAATALLDFLASVIRGENDCARIYSIESGYHHRVVGAFGEIVLAPAWRVETDAGRFLIDDATGEIRSLQ